MPVNLFVFRHGETDWNRQRRLQGHTDIPLNDVGRKQALRLAPLLKPYGLDCILTSSLDRARETAVILNQGLGLPLFETRALIECGLGQAEGLLKSEVEIKFGKAVFEKWLSIDPQDIDFSFPGGERKQDHLDRMVNYVEDFIAQNPQYSNIAIATHGGGIRRLIHHCKGAPAEPAVVPNCVPYHMTYDPKTHIWTYISEVK